MLFLFSKKQVAFISFLFGLPLLIFGVYYIVLGFSDYLLLFLMFIIGILLIIGGFFAYKDSHNEKF
jgi:hypothetical protein